MSKGHGHSHPHGLTGTGQHRKRLLLAVGITGTVLVAEVIGGLMSGSLALLADAGHMLTDSAGLVIALLAASLATRPATSARTFGLQRASAESAGGGPVPRPCRGRPECCGSAYEAGARPGTAP